jgi:diguanylate cyclase (GGDEF)-like protein
MRRSRRPSRRELVAACLTSGSFLAVAIPFALLAGSSRQVDVPVLVLLCLTLAVLSQLELEIGSGSAVPTQLAFVPMLFLLPLRILPLAVCASFVVGGVLDLFRGALRASRALSLVGCAWFALPPALVLYLAGEGAPAWSHWPVYLTALAAQFAGDFAHAVFHERLAHDLPPRDVGGPLARVYAFDLLLSPVALLGALATSAGRFSFLALLPLVGVFVALANERRRRLDAALEAARLEQVALTDVLTGLANRRGWEERLALLLEEPNAEPVAICLIDLDHFKAFNDEHGHPAGDALLVEAANAWRRRLGVEQVVARLGGEEFGLALPGCDQRQAQLIVDHLRACIPDGQTCSVGIASHQRGESRAAVMRRADDALYEAKKAGRNRIAVAA